ncbi:MAG: hypothetical protein LUC34_02020 [Campylobacter sp.]|nr:hypothetical protein [Campylobacter sp.]
MSVVKLNLLKKYEIAKELSYVKSSVVLPCGDIVILAGGAGEEWNKNYLFVIQGETTHKILLDCASGLENEPVLLKFKSGFGVMADASAIYYYEDILQNPRKINISNSGVIPKIARLRSCPSVSDAKEFAIGFEKAVYFGDARNYALLNLDLALKVANWEYFGAIDSGAFAYHSDKSYAPKIDSFKIKGGEIYAFTSGGSITSVNKWGMDYYALVQISRSGKVARHIITSENLKTDGKKRGINAKFTNSDFVILTPVFKSDEWRGKQKLFSLSGCEYLDIVLPKGMSKHLVQNIDEKLFLTSLYDRGLVEIALCEVQ